ncbi:MAG TPA: ankyrin repeat domain-containing protein [Kofleriaceae bacterium]|nr:ankyrin repeat domain-containing protein [Kofleriaceae bacterium]
MSKTRLLEAIRALDVATAGALLDAKPSLMAITDRAGLALIFAACSVDCAALGVPESAAVRMVKALVARGADPRAEMITAREGHRINTTWFAAARGKNRRLVRFLVEQDAAPLGLFAAGYAEDLPMIRLLVELGADVDEVVGDGTPFLLCWTTRRFKAAALLLRSGADVNVQDGRGRTALHHALEKDYDLAQVRLLLEHGAALDIADRTGVTPAARASRKRNKAYLAALG